MRREFVLKSIALTAIAIAIVLDPRIALAHAVLTHSTPAANSTVQGPDLPITLKFNSRVDGTRSTLLLVDPSGKSTPLTIDKQTASDTLTTHAAQLSAGKYAIQWQVLAVDGHITRGQIPFEVK